MLFQDLLNKETAEAVASLKFSKPTEIQTKTIPWLLKNKNIIGVAPTGTGKTLCFLIPAINKIDTNNGLQGIIIAPTRELARQIYEKTEPFRKANSDLRIRLLVGGVEMSRQINGMAKAPHLIVATPTRLKEIYKVGAISLKEVNTFILDEADMLMDLGFFKDIDYLYNQLDHEHTIQKMAWSATLHELLSRQLKKYYKDTKIVQVGGSIWSNDNIKHYLIHTEDKYHALSIVIKTINPYMCLIFCNTKKEVKEIYQYLLEQNRSVIMIHGGLPPRERKNNYRDIKKLKYQYVIASDLASRGLDIEGASHVISWNLADDAEWYMHRSGRVGRSKYLGESYVMYDKKDDNKLLSLMDKGVKFNHITIKNNELIEKDYTIKRKPKIHNKASDIEVKKLISKSKQKVKPGYKKKLKKDIRKIEQKHKRSHIDKTMKEKRIKQYKIENSKKSNSEE